VQITPFAVALESGALRSLFSVSASLREQA
jgi:hypothetical protein